MGQIFERSVRKSTAIEMHGMFQYVALHARYMYSKFIVMNTNIYDFYLNAPSVFVLLTWFSSYSYNLFSLMKDKFGGGDGRSQWKGSTKPSLNPAADENNVHCVQQLLWFNNKLQFSLRNLYSMHREKMLMKHKVLFYFCKCAPLKC